MGFPGSSDGKVSACCAGDLGSIPGSGRPPGEEHGNPLQYSCLENSMDRGVWQATVHAVAKSGTRLTLAHLDSGCLVGLSVTTILHLRLVPLLENELAHFMPRTFPGYHGPQNIW